MTKKSIVERGITLGGVLAADASLARNRGEELFVLPKAVTCDACGREKTAHQCPVCGNPICLACLARGETCGCGYYLVIEKRAEEEKSDGKN